jgi:uncharacterized small protein (DUF1192 family)
MRSRSLTTRASRGAQRTGDNMNTERNYAHEVVTDVMHSQLPNLVTAQRARDQVEYLQEEIARLRAELTDLSDHISADNDGRTWFEEPLNLDPLDNIAGYIGHIEAALDNERMAHESLKAEWGLKVIELHNATAEIARLRAVLERLANYDGMCDSIVISDMRKIARAALSKVESPDDYRPRPASTITGHLTRKESKSCG